MANPILEAATSSMDDNELVHYIGTLYETLKRLKEHATIDEQVIELKKQLKDYEYEHYGRDTKIATLKLKAARQQAKMRGVVFTIPPGSDET